MPPHGWTCFHCGETFSTIGGAHQHFGFDPSCDPACRVKLGAERGLLGAFRRLEQENERLRTELHCESAEGLKAYRALQGRVEERVRLAEELGYERGLADGRELHKSAKAKVALPPRAKTATKRDAIIRTKCDRAARELEQPVDALPGMKPKRMVHATPAQAAPIIAAMKAKREFIVPPNPLEARRQRLQRAIDWLNQRAWFVQIVNREAPVRTYRVAGKRDPMLAEDVIRVALEKGMVE